LRDAAAFFAFALRWILYAIATACLTGLPDFTSAETLRLKQFWEAHFRVGIIFSYSLCRSFSRANSASLLPDRSP